MEKADRKNASSSQGSRTRRLIAELAGIFTLLSAPASGSAQTTSPAVAAPLVDHHIHLGSPALSKYIEEVDKQDPSVFQQLSRDIFSKPTPADALHILDEAGVRQAVMLSSGYLYVPSGPLPDPAAAARNMRAENRFTVDTALASHGRLIAFIAINPFAANAKSEFAYWKSKKGVEGIKLHLGGAGFHASSPEQVATLAKFFSNARKAHLPLVVHLRGAGPFPKSEVQTFIDKVLSQAGDLPVQIAHGGGYAGADPATIDSLTAFGDAIARHAPGTKNLVFDISGVVLPDQAAAAIGSTDAQLKLFADKMRQIGLDRFVIGSDWPAIGRIGPYFALMRQKLPVSEAEWEQLCNNRAPYLRGWR